MIYYESRKTCSLFQIKGSVLPKALLRALPAGLVALALKFLEASGVIDLSYFGILSQGSIFSGFTFVMGFAVVFRTGQSYSRYWSAATAIHQTSTEWLDACGSIIAFVERGSKQGEEKYKFVHTLVRLISLMHAMALEEIADLRNEDFPLLDINAFKQEELAILADEESQGLKVSVVLNWIKVLVVQALKDGLLGVPAPIVTRAFQQLGKGLVDYHSAQIVVIWPFPFPYTQINFLMLVFYVMLTPLVICTWSDTNPWLCCAFTLVTCTGVLSLDMIANELENPFGEDDNDLPCFEMQHMMNSHLLTLLNPDMWTVPQLMQDNILDYGQLVHKREADMQSFKEYQEKGFVEAQKRRRVTKETVGRPRAVTERLLSGEPSKGSTMHHVLPAETRDSANSMDSVLSSGPRIPEWLPDPPPPPKESQPLTETPQKLEPEIQIDPVESPQSGPLAKNGYQAFLEDFSARFQLCLDEQMKASISVAERQIAALEELLSQQSRSARSFETAVETLGFATNHRRHSSTIFAL
eukprot:gnl/TRDRNA2_/TRDRNA2_176605_c0_seq7.p1 gnl/TRDRNA2_/TRDRNA2_176605_c0~~gnl/TRDRNA2_/TRDRNA2_176605_c0_seq7.p1  ORF type:complete len:525 (+),score=69.56 gnl/TRDRNA2_/TRDRNA2_176605_c0_seq7:63-1637(+)